MNIISNSCVGGFLMRDHFKQEYSNPFIWSYIDTKSFYNLIKNFDTLDWFNYELIKDDKWNFSLIIDNQVKVEYPHYHFDKNATVPTVEKGPLHRDVYYNRIWEYITEKYTNRVNRMLSSNEKPIFILGTKYDYREMHNYNPDYLKLIDDLETKYTVILVSKHFKFNNKKCYTFKHSTDNIELAKEIYKMNII